MVAIRLQTVTALAAMLSVAVSSAVHAQVPYEAGVHVPIDVDTPADYPGAANGSGTQWIHVLEHPGATYLAIHFVGFDLGAGDYVVITDAEGHQEYVLTGRGKQDAGTFWARHIKGDTAVLQLIVTGPDGGRGFSIDEYVAGNVDLGKAGASAKPSVIEALCGTDDKRNAVCYQSSHPTAYDRSRAVARLLINGSRLCTGALVSTHGHLLTNQHCILSEAEALNTDYEFMAEAPNCTSANCYMCDPGTVISGGVLVKTNVELDYSLVHLTENNPADTYGYLEIDDRDAVVGEQIYLPQHPAGQAKEIALESGQASDLGGVARIHSLDEPSCSNGSYHDIGYFADTEGGSSGSPVIAMSSHRLIALHHCANCPNRGVPMALIYPEISEYITYSATGEIEFGQDVVNCAQELEVLVRDGDLVYGDPIAVQVLTTGGDSEYVTLMESTPGSGRFIGSISTRDGAVVKGDSVLQITDGQAILGVYADQHNEAGYQASDRDIISVDCLPPLISGIQLADLAANSATVTFETDEHASGVIRYGTSCEGLDSASAGSSYPIAHSITISGLNPGTTYHYLVQAADPAGNTATDDNGGTCHAFTTTLAPSHFTEQFHAKDNDVAGLSLTFTPDGSSDFYTTCLRPISRLPVSLDSGNPVSLSLYDDHSLRINLTNRTVRLYGEAYDHFYVGSNGYITFTIGDSAREESPAAHFALPRISALFDDLNPAVGGSVTWMGLQDRSVVTWTNVPEFGTTNRNTFQIELLYDGVIRISWLRIDAKDGLVGVSRGNGTPTDFSETNITDLARCRPSDFDLDSDVDLDDFGWIQACLGGPDEPVGSECAGADLDADNDVDRHDVDLFRICMTAAHVAAPSGCAN